jgi:hypothetical protein
MLEYFQELGNHVSQLWNKTNQNHESFPDLALEGLSSSRVLEKVEPEEISMWLMGGSGVPEQIDSGFGQPPVNLYVSDKFRIEALFWVNGTTAIHEHAFAGAFGVLAGSSVHSTYQFERAETISSRLLRGKLCFQKAELLSRGDTRKILPDDRFIHSLFHLDRPSISLVIRTSTKVSERPQYEYKKPYVALDNFAPPVLEIIQLRMLDALLNTNLKSFWTAANRAAFHCSTWMLYHLLALAHQQCAETSNWENLLAIVNQRHAGLAEHILPCIAEERRMQRIISLRAEVQDPAERFILALLLKVPTRTEIDKLIAVRFPGECPEHLIAKYLGAIFSEKKMGIRLSSSSVSLLKLMLQHSDFEHAKQMLGDTVRSSDDHKWREAWNTLRSVDIFAPLFAEAA